MSEQKLVKIVYGYDIDRDAIAARHFYNTGASEVLHHSRREWEDLLYDIRKNQSEVVIRTAVDELQDEQSI